MRLLTYAALALGLLLAPAVARADDEGEDVVVVNDGTTWRGHITELVGGDHVTVQMANGQEARIRWDAIVRLDRAGGSRPPTTAEGGPPVRVHIDSERDVVLERVHPRGTKSGRYELVCAAPCDREIATGGPYRIAGGGIRSTSAFTLQGAPGQTVVLSVDHGTTAGFVGGIVLTSLGGATTIVGGAFLLISAAVRSERDNLAVVGGVTTAVGIGMLVPGLVLLTNNSSSTVTQAAPVSREPTWTKPVSPAGTPASLAVPIAGGSF